MAPFGVEIDQIDEDQPAVGGRLQRVDEEVDVAVVALALALLAGVAMGEDVADLADRDDRAARARGALQEIAGRRRNREILAVGGADEILGALADERPGDDAADVERIAEPARDAAEIVEPLEPERLLMRGDLQHRIGRGVADRLQRPQVLLAVVLDDSSCPDACRLARMPGSLPSAISAIGQRGRERRGSFRGNSPSRIRPACRQSPNGRTACPCRARSRRHSPIGRAARASAKPGGARPVDACIAWPRPSASRCGSLKRAAPQAVAVAAPLRAGFRDMAERVGARVAVSLGILRAAAADRIRGR